MWGNQWGQKESEYNKWNYPSERQFNIEEAPWFQEGSELEAMDNWGDWGKGEETYGYYSTTKDQGNEYQQEVNYGGGYMEQARQQQQHPYVGKVGVGKKHKGMYGQLQQSHLQGRQKGIGHMENMMSWQEALIEEQLEKARMVKKMEEDEKRLLHLEHIVELSIKQQEQSTHKNQEIIWREETPYKMQAGRMKYVGDTEGSSAQDWRKQERVENVMLQGKQELEGKGKARFRLKNQPLKGIRWPSEKKETIDNEKFQEEIKEDTTLSNTEEMNRLQQQINQLTDKVEDQERIAARQETARQYNMLTIKEDRQEPSKKMQSWAHYSEWDETGQWNAGWQNKDDEGKRKYKKGKREKEGRDESEWDKSDENEKPAKSWDWKWYQELSEGSDLEYKKANSRQGISKKQQKKDTGKKERMKIEYSEEESEEGWQATQGEYGKGIQEGHQNKWKQQGKQLEKRERETKKKFYPPDTFARDDKQGNTKRGRDRRWEYLKEDKRRVKKRNWVHISSEETESSEDGKQDMRNRYQQIQELRKREEKINPGNKKNT